MDPNSSHFAPLPSTLISDVRLAADRFIEQNLPSHSPVMADLIRLAFMRGAQETLIWVEHHHDAK